MAATIQLPDLLARRLEKMAKDEGTSVDSLVGRMLSEQLEQHDDVSVRRMDLRFPLLSRQETGPISPVTGKDIDEMFSRDSFSS